MIIMTNMTIIHKLDLQPEQAELCVQVSIDAQGLMKITHMVNLQHIMDQDSYLGASAYSESQASRADSIALPVLSSQNTALKVKKHK